jgi:23S rRNA pseudouridine2605 synthase
VQRIRLNRYLAQAGVASRRGADRLIAAGRVRVNGVQVEELGILVLPGRDQIEVDGEAVAGIELPRYVAVHKPRGVVTTVRDPQGRPTILELIGDRTWDARLFPVGRLDLDSEGLLLLTNDGTLAHRLLHPRYHVAKRYRVWTEPSPRAIDLEQLAAGVEIEPGVATRPAAVGDTGEGWFELEIREGKKRQIRRMCEALGLKVTRLLRTSFGPIELGDLAAGQFRALTPAEVESLDLAAGLPDRKRPAGAPGIADSDDPARA